MKKIALIQMCSSEDVDENILIATSLISQSSNQGASLVVLPEMFPLISHNLDKKLQAIEIYKEGKIQKALSLCAKKNDVWIVGGTIPLASSDPHRSKAATLVFDNEGDIVARYDKIHLFETSTFRESDTVMPGDEAVVISSPIGKIGLTVCYDLRFPALYTHLHNLGAKIIMVPSAFTVETGQAHWELLMRARAVETQCYMVGACQGGLHASGRQTYGHSLVVDPWGTVVASTNSFGNHIVYAHIDLSLIDQVRDKLPMTARNTIKLDIAASFKN
jgi:predicted amidohydrolase